MKTSPFVFHKKDIGNWGRRKRILACLFTFSLLLACPGTKARTCAEGCESGTTCDDATQLCVKPDAIKCIDGRACGAVCEGQGPTTCAVGQTCQNQRCAPTPASSGNYAACALDADCQRGDFCKLGACSHECVRDGDCKEGTVCSARGRCLAAEQVSQPPPPQVISKGRVGVMPNMLDFTLSAQTLKVTLRNLGGDPYDFRILASQAGIDVTPFEGRVSGQPVELTVSLNRALYKGDNAFLAINTTAGYERIPVQVASKLDGTWSASFSAETPIALGSHVAFFDVKEGAQGVVSGVVDGERSPLFPLNAPMVGTVTADTVTLAFRMVAAVASNANPVVPNQIGREVKLNVKRTGANSMEGTFTEELFGVATERLTVSGKVALSRTGPATSILVALPDVPVPAIDISNPYSNAVGSSKAEYNGCKLLCPTTNCQASPGRNGDDIFNGYKDARNGAARASAALVDRFSLSAETDGSNPFLGSLVSVCTYPDCIQSKVGYDSIYLGCSQYWYSRDVTTAPAAFLDSAEVVAATALLSGNGNLTVAVDGAFAAGGTFDAQAQVFQRAAETFNAGLYGSGTALGLAHPRVASLFSGLNAQQIVQSANLLKGDRPAGVQFSKALNAVSLAGFANGQRAQILRRKSDDLAAKTVLQRGALGMYLSTLALSVALQKSPSTWTVELAEVNTQWQTLLADYKAVAEGRNVLGFSPNYVPFFWNKDNLAQGQTNFQQLLYLARQNVGVWNTAFVSAQSNNRAFEASANALESELTEQKQRVDAQIVALCGAGTTSRLNCANDAGEGKSNASEFAQRLLEVQAAVKRQALVTQQIENLGEEIAIEEQRAREVSGERDNIALIIKSTGMKVAMLEEVRQTINQVQQVKNGISSGVSGFLNAAFTGNVLGAIGQLGLGIANAAIDSVASGVLGDLDRARQEAQLDERVAIEYSQSKIELINSAAIMKAKFLQTKTLDIESKMAQLNFAQAIGRVLALEEQVSSLFEYRERLQKLNGTKARQSNAFRILAQKDARLALDSQRKALTFAFLASRALAYQLNEPLALNALWAVREPKDLTAVLQDLENRAGTTLTAQGRTDRISLRDTILGFNTPVKDTQTGAFVTSRERFKQFVASPQNRDELGRFRLRFTTNSPANPIFSNALGSDRITGLKLNLVGDNLGAGLSTVTVRVVHGGTSSLRKRMRGPNGTAELVEYDMTGLENLPRTAQLQAGVNAPNGGAGLVENIEFRERSTLATSWKMSIDTSSSEPGNVNFNLGGLDDIELIVSHDAYTIQ